MTELFFSFGSSIPFAFVLEFVAGFAFVWTSLILQAAIQTSMTEDHVPRGIGLLFFYWYFGQFFGNLSSGFLAEYITLGRTFQIYGGVLILYAAKLFGSLIAVS